jgi:hypothetical protein
MRCTVSGILALFIGTAVLCAQEPPKDQPKPDQPSPAAEAYQNLTKEYQKALKELEQACKDATTDEAKQKVFAKYHQNIGSFAPRFLELAQKNPKEAVAVEALVWVVENATVTPAAEKAVDLLIQDHLQNDKVKNLGRRISFIPAPAAEKLLRAVLGKATEPEAQVQACNALAQFLKNKSEAVHLLKGADEELVKQVELMYGKDFAKKMREIDPDKAAKEAEELYERIINKYADVKDIGKVLAESAKSSLYEMRNLALGKVAPEIEGEDIDGKKFKLSDYRGKVVVLDFWGHW